jgi:hypothetical protein
MPINAAWWTELLSTTSEEEPSVHWDEERGNVEIMKGSLQKLDVPEREPRFSAVLGSADECAVERDLMDGPRATTTAPGHL